MKKSKANFLTLVIWALALGLITILICSRPGSAPVVGYLFAIPGVISCIAVTRAYIYGGGNH